MTTCRDALRAASGMLAQAGVPDPAVDAAFLLSHVTGTPHLLLRAEGCPVRGDRVVLAEARWDGRSAG